VITGNRAHADRIVIAFVIAGVMGMLLISPALRSKRSR
jgi:hypothetical protein